MQLKNMHRGETLKLNEKPCTCYGEEIFANRIKIKYPTNNDAEYMSLIRAMEEAILYGLEGIIVFMDSKLVVNQVNNKWKINYNHLQIYKSKIDNLRKKVKINVYHIKRNYNQWADYFSKYIIDRTKRCEDEKFKF